MTCPNGHDTAPAAAFCAKCGALLAPAPAPGPPADAVEPGKTRSRTGLVAAASVLVVAAALVVTAIATGGDRDDTPPASASGDEDAADTPYGRALTPDEEVFVDRVETGYDYASAARGLSPEEVDEEFASALSNYGYDDSRDPTPQLAVIYAKAACMQLEGGGDPTTQLGIEFRDQAGGLSDPVVQVLVTTGWYCPRANLSPISQ